MSIIKAKEHLKKYNLDDRVLEFNVSSATVKDAALALNCTEGEIAKTLSFLTDKPILIITAGDPKIDNAKYKHTFGEKAHMLSFDEVPEITGHPVGGVCPFGVKEGVDIYLDESLKVFDTVFPACGAPNNAIEVSIPELEEITGYTGWVDVCKEREN